MRRGVYRLGALFLALAAWGWSATTMGLSIVLTPEMDLQSAQAHYRFGTNDLAQGRFREALANFQWSARIVKARLLEMKRRRESLDVLREQIDVIQRLKSRFGEDWMDAALEAETIRFPLREMVDTLETQESDGLAELQGEVMYALKALDRLSDACSKGNRDNAEHCLDNICFWLQRQIEVGEHLPSLDDDFCVVSSELRQAFEKWKEESARPLDVVRALEIAKSYQVQAAEKIGTEAWVGAIADIDYSRLYLDDVRQTAQLEAEVAVQSAALEETERQFWLRGAHYYLDEAKGRIDAGDPSAKWSLDAANKCYLSPLSVTGGEEYEALVREAEELKAVVERMWFGTP